MYALRFKNELPAIVAKELEHFLGALKAWIAVDHNEDGSHHISVSNEVPVGAISAWGGSAAPTNWLLCDGAAVSRTTYQSLFAIVGTTYGTGDGSTTFNVPNLQQRFPLGKAASGTGNTLGATGGAIDHTHSGGSHTHSISSVGDHSHGGSTGADGSHTHTVSGTTGTNDTSTSRTTVDPLAAVAQDGHTHSFSATSSSDGSHSHSISAGGGHDHGGATGSASGSTGTNNPPYLVVNFIILAGV